MGAEAVIEAIYIAFQAGARMRRIEEIQAIAGFGLSGDRYSERKGIYSGIDECQVTLIEGEDLDEISRTTGLSIKDGEHRRNIVTRGIKLGFLSGKLFRIGEAVFQYDRPRPPCGYLQSITQPGMTEALMGRAGICARVVKSGTIRAQDRIEVLGRLNPSEIKAGS